ISHNKEEAGAKPRTGSSQSSRGLRCHRHAASKPTVHFFEGRMKSLLPPPVNISKQRFVAFCCRFFFGVLLIVAALLKGEALFGQQKTGEFWASVFLIEAEAFV